MSKKSIKTVVMNQIVNGEINMKPRWYFILGSMLMSAGLVGLSIGALFLTNVTFFLLRQHGQMGNLRLQIMLETFPWWIPILALLGIVGGVFFLKKFDFSYKNNFSSIIFIFITAIVLGAFIIDFTGINDTWFKRGRMRKFYEPRQQTQEYQQYKTSKQ